MKLTFLSTSSSFFFLGAANGQFLREGRSLSDPRSVESKDPSYKPAVQELGLPQGTSSSFPNQIQKYDPNRLCIQNQYAKSLSLPLSEYGILMDKWLDNKIAIEKELTSRTIGFPWNHDRFDAFQVMGDCEKTCIGGECREDTSKIVCGVTDNQGRNAMEAPCVVYSIGGNNQWEFELDALAKTPCEVHTFDCTGPIERFEVPQDDRLHFHHICLGQENKPAPSVILEADNVGAIYGEFMTLEKIQKTFGHTKIDLLKVDIEGYEWPMFEFWPENTDMRSFDMSLPMQVLVEVHYKALPVSDLAPYPQDFKFTTDMINLQTHLLKMGYAVVKRDDNSRCPHCTELTLVRIRCPEDTLSI